MTRSGPKVKNFLTRFWSKVEPLPSGCWRWTGATQRENGYGRFAYRDHLAGYAHRIAFELHHRTDLRATARLTQTCGHRWCVNPDHLAMRETACTTPSR